MMNKISKTFLILTAISIFLTSNIFAQKSKGSTDKKTPIIPEVIKVDDQSIKEILKPKGKPLLVNFWATWCVPCREEFPELVELDKEYKGKIDFITISLDDLAEINRDVPKFLKEMKATMPAYLLKTNDENAVIGSISKEWSGGLPFTVLYNEKSKVVHTRQGKIKVDIVKEKLNFLLLKSSHQENFVKGKTDALDDLSNGKLILKHHNCRSKTIYKSELVKKRGFLYAIIGKLPKPKPIENEANFQLSCKTTNNYKEIRYMEGYNSISKPEILKTLELKSFQNSRFDTEINYPAKITEVILTKN